MNRIFHALPVLLSLVMGGMAYAQSAPAHPLTYVRIKTTDAKGINLLKYKGKELILVLFSTECEDCIETVNVLSKIQQDFGKQGLQVIGAGVNTNAPYTVGAWVQRYKPSFPVGFLDQDAMIKLAAVKKDDRPFVPIVMFVDSVGIVKVQYFGNNGVFKNNQQEKAFRAIAEGLLRLQHSAPAKPKAPAVAKPETPPAAKPEP